MRDNFKTSWQSRVIQQVCEAVRNDPFWGSRLSEVVHDKSSNNDIHLAVFVEPFLQFMLEGKKTVESRFSKRLRAPHKRVKKGDVILLKRSGGAVVGICQVGSVWFYTLGPESLRAMRNDFAWALCANSPGFWSDRRHMSFATLMRVSNVVKIGPIPCAKQDRRGWVVLTHRDSQDSLLGGCDE